MPVFEREGGLARLNADGEGREVDAEAEAGDGVRGAGGGGVEGSG